MAANTSTRMRNQVAGAESVGVRAHWLYYAGGAAALAVLALFLIGITAIINTGAQQANTGGWFAALQNNWLVVLFKINAGSEGVHADSLNVLNLLDISIMALFCVMFLALYGALRHDSRTWATVATALPFLGIPVFLATSMAGRSALFFAGLIMSAVMLRGNTFSKPSAYVGILASTLLFFGGDIGTAIFSSVNVIAIVIGIGYVLWMIWFSLIARTLFRLGKGVSLEGADEN